MGATTIWERWDSVRPDGTINPSGMTSLNHYALGAVVDWMHRTIGGLTALEPGYRRMLIAPKPGGGLTSGALRHTTVHGEVRVAWRLDGGTATLEVSIPTGSTAEVVLPLHPDRGSVEAPAGEHHWSYAIDTAAGPASFDLDSPLGRIAADPAAWRRFTDVFARYYPGVPLDGHAPEAAGMPVRTLLDYLPGVSDEFRADLTTSLTTGAPA